jgi:hypothetical protein
MIELEIMCCCRLLVFVVKSFLQVLLLSLMVLV